jgi:hypothetical protein
MRQNYLKILVDMVLLSEIYADFGRIVVGVASMIEVKKPEIDFLALCHVETMGLSPCPMSCTSAMAETARRGLPFLTFSDVFGSQGRKCLKAERQ